jgi:hypothetical protein
MINDKPELPAILRQDLVSQYNDSFKEPPLRDGQAAKGPRSDEDVAIVSFFYPPLPL